MADNLAGLHGIGKTRLRGVCRSFGTVDERVSLVNDFYFNNYGRGWMV